MAVRPRFLFVLPFAAALWMGAAPSGAAQDLYAVSNIAVDQTAASEVEAKNQGIADAKRQAFEEILRRLTLAPAVGDPAPASDQPSLIDEGAAVDPAPVPPPPPVPDDASLEFMIRDLSFQEEKFGGGRYLAKMTVRYQPAAVNRYLQRAGTPYLSAPSALAVILPLFRDPGGVQLWSELNPWLDAWWSLEEPGTVVPFTVPLGDLADIAAIDRDRALAVDAGAINAIAARYRAGAVIAPIAAMASDGEGVLVEVSTFGAGWPSAPELLSFTRAALEERIVSDADPEEDPPVLPADDTGLLRAAAALTVDALEARWKSANILRFDQDAETLTASVSLSRLNDWLAVRAGLDRTAPIKAWRLVELSTVRAVVSIDYVGDSDRLNQALARVALGLAPDEEGGEGAWVLIRR